MWYTNAQMIQGAAFWLAMGGVHFLIQHILVFEDDNQGE